MTDDDQPKEDDVVGPGNPPRHRRFKPGQSGNPKGRPKGSHNLATIAKKEGSKKITVKEGGRTRTVSKMEVAAAQQWQKAMLGNVASAKLMFEQAAKADDVQPGAHSHLAIPKLDRNAMRRIAERVLRNTEEVTTDEPNTEEAGDEPTSNE